MKRTRRAALLAGGGLILGSAAIPGCLWLRAIPPHVGDGQFEDRSWRFPSRYVGVPVPGYAINFPEFDLATEFEAWYHLENLPAMEDKLGVYLSINDPQGNWRADAIRQKLAAQILFEVTDQNGKVVCRVEQPLAKMTWAQPEGGDYGLYVLDDSFFVPRQGTRYTLRVRYTPDPKLTGLKGFIHMRCGGSI